MHIHPIVQYARSGDQVFQARSPLLFSWLPPALVFPSNNQHSLVCWIVRSAQQGGKTLLHRGTQRGRPRAACPETILVSVEKR